MPGQVDDNVAGAAVHGHRPVMAGARPTLPIGAAYRGASTPRASETINSTAPSQANPDRPAFLPVPADDDCHDQDQPHSDEGDRCGQLPRDVEAHAGQQPANADRRSEAPRPPGRSASPAAQPGVPPTSATGTVGGRETVLIAEP